MGMKYKIGLLAVAVGLTLANVAAASAATVEGQVEIAGDGVAGSNVTLWAANAGAPREMGHATTNAKGHFSISGIVGGDTLYVLAKGGKPAAGNADESGLVLLALLGEKPPEKLVVNELTTVASAYTADRFVSGNGISGNPLGLKIAADNVSRVKTQ